MFSHARVMVIGAGSDLNSLSIHLNKIIASLESVLKFLGNTQHFY